MMNTDTTIKAFKLSNFFWLFSALVLSACANNYSDSSKHGMSSPGDSYVFFGGNILTMHRSYEKPENRPEAILVEHGVITMIGAADELKFFAKYDDFDVELIDLQGKTLMPGFVEPHTHLPLLISFSGIADLSPCLPGLYKYRYYAEQPDCSTSLSGTLEIFNESPYRDLEGTDWMVGAGIDPSRLGNKNIGDLREFIDNPAQVLGNPEKITDVGNKPIFLLDQSGHVAYVNIQAFVSAGICEEVLDCGPDNMDNMTPDGQIAYDELIAKGTGTWVVGTNGNFTGKLLEEPSYLIFLSTITNALEENRLAILEALGKKEDTPIEGDSYLNSPFFFHTLNQGKDKAPTFIDEFAKTGVTTIVNAGGFMKSEVEFIETLALAGLDDSKLRYRSLVSVDIVDQDHPLALPQDIAESLHTETWDYKKNKGLYGVYGVKLWVDGSTQGCSGYLEKKYADKGLCAGTKGRAGYNYKPIGLGTKNNVARELRNYWGDKWLIQVHANGDAAMKQTTDAFEVLQEERCGLGLEPNTNPLVIHHATVGGDPKTTKNAIEMIGVSRDNAITCASIGGNPVKLDITLSHTPAHIAYWGGAFQSILDGKGTRAPDGKIEDDSGGRSTMIDATGSDITYDIPFSLHSDVPVSPVNPLWYVEQVVSRNTWFYPNIDTDDAVTMPVSNVKGFGRQNADRYEALRAITIVPARQNLLGNKIGSIAEEKIADLVILDGDPTDVSTDILSINVISTFVNGIKHCWAAEC